MIRIQVKASLVFLSFWLLFLCCYLLSPFVHSGLEFFVKVKAEYTVYEQLSKYYLFIVVLLAIHGYENANEPSKVHFSVGVLLIALVMYLAESNMLVSRSQPIFAIGIFGYTAYVLIKKKVWHTLLLMGLGCFFILLGVVSDFASEHQLVRSYLPVMMASYLNTQYEEIYDLIGIAQICAAILIHYWSDVEDFVKGNMKGTALLLFNSALITIGNGFLHYQYSPGKILSSSALIIMMLGFSGLIITNRYLIERRKKLKIVTEARFYLFTYIFFMMLPVAFGSTGLVESLFFWLPTMLGLGILLFLKHPRKAQM